MTFSYDEAQSTVRDRIRFLIGETDSANHQIQDEEIDATISANPNESVEWLAWEVGAARAGRLDALVSVSAGAVRVSLSDRAKAAHAMLDRLWKLAGRRARSADCVGFVAATGQSRDENDLRDADYDTEPNRFRRRQFDSPNWLYESDYYRGDRFAYEDYGGFI